MPYSPEQWRAIAARVMREKGEKRGRAYLRELKRKVEAEGHPLIRRTDTRTATRRRKRRRRAKRG